MILARIIGTVVATRKDPRLEGKKLLICRPVDPDGHDEKGYIVAVDTVARRLSRESACRAGKFSPHGIRMQGYARGCCNRRDRRLCLAGLNMYLGKVIGRVVCSIKDEALESKTLLLVKRLPDGPCVVAIDAVGAGA